MKPLNASTKKSLEAATAAAHLNLAEAEPFLKARGFDLDTAERLRLGVVQEAIPGQSSRLVGRLCIPYLSLNGVTWAQFRCMEDHNCKEEHQDKFQSWQSLPGRLYNLPALNRADDEIHLTEGPMDAIALESCGLPAIGIPGAEHWKKHHSRVFAGFRRVLFWPDNDKAGRSLTKTLMADLEQLSIVSLPQEGDDVDAFLIREGPEAVLQLLKESQ